MTNKRFLSSVLAFVVIGVSARASVTTYCDSSSPLCTDNSAAFSNAGLLAIDFTSAMIVSNSFTDPTTSTAFGNWFGGTMTNPTDALTNSENGFQITLPTNTMVFALNYQAPSGSVFVNFTVGVTNYDYTLTSSSVPLFFAVTSDQPLTNLVVSGSPENPATITNFELQGTQMSDTPEVGTLLLIGSGLIAMRYMRRARSYFFRTPQTA